MSCNLNFDAKKETPQCRPFVNNNAPAKLAMDENGVIWAYDRWDNFIGFATVGEDGIVTIKRPKP